MTTPADHSPGAAPLQLASANLEMAELVNLGTASHGSLVCLVKQLRSDVVQTLAQVPELPCAGFHTTRLQLVSEDVTNAEHVNLDKASSAELVLLVEVLRDDLSDAIRIARRAQFSDAA